MANRASLEILTTQESARWREALEEIGEYSFYHLPAFHRLSELQAEGEAFMPIFREAGRTIAFPMLVRSIELASGAATGLRDVTSVPGFAGPLTPRGVPEHIRQHFLAELQGFFQEMGVVSAYARLHPLLDQSSLLSGYGELNEMGVTLSVDLTQTPEEQFSRYRTTRRKEIRRLKGMGFYCEELGPARLDDFLGIYYDTMDRVGAHARFHVDRCYFEYLMREMGDVAHLYACMLDGAIAGAAICFVCGGIMDVFRGGTPNEYVPLSPIKLLYHGFSAWGRGMGTRAVHLGGGVGAQRDSLYDYKLAFGPDEHIYYTWRHVVDRRLYDELCSEVFRNAGIEPVTSYFPAYRSPALKSEPAVTS